MEQAVLHVLLEIESIILQAFVLIFCLLVFLTLDYQKLKKKRLSLNKKAIEWIS